MNKIEPLYRMEELFDLLEAVREAEASATAASSDAYSLKSLIAQEHEEAKAESHSLCPNSGTSNILSLLSSAREHRQLQEAYE